MPSSPCIAPSAASASLRQISTRSAFVTFAVIPFGPVVNMFGEQTPLQLTDMPVAVLFVMAIASIGIYGIVLAGWSSGSTYPLLGGLRSSAQMISYEVAMGLSLEPDSLHSSTIDLDIHTASQLMALDRLAHALDARVVIDPACSPACSTGSAVALSRASRRTRACVPRDAGWRRPARRA